MSTKQILPITGMLEELNDKLIIAWEKHFNIWLPKVENDAQIAIIMKVITQVRTFEEKQQKKIQEEKLKSLLYFQKQVSKAKESESLRILWILKQMKEDQHNWHNDENYYSIDDIIERISSNQ